MSHAVEGRALSLSASFAICAAALWGVSALRVSLPPLVYTPPRDNTDVIDTVYPKPQTQPPKPLDRAPIPRPHDDVTPLPVAPPTDFEIARPPTQAGPPTIAPPAPRITNPTWIRKPSTEELMDYYPQRAFARDLAGRVTLECIVAANGRIACVVAQETPEGYGFGKAALDAARLFRIAPQLTDGAPTEGGRIAVTIAFKPPAS